MFKRSIKTFIIGLIFVCAINVNATKLEEMIEPGDIVIGNTVFRSDDWISASRASKAGALYAMNNGATDVRVFYYDEFEDWYEYNDKTLKYELIKEPTLSKLGDIIKVYYDNNEPLTNTYESYVEYEYDEISEEYYPMEFNRVFTLFNSESAEIKINDEKIKLDYDNKTISCPFGYTFRFEIQNEDMNTKYIGICGFDEFKYESEEEYNLEKLKIESIELVSSSEDEILVNQDKVVVESNGDGYFNISVKEELEDIFLPQTGMSSTYVAFDVKFTGKALYEFLHNLRDPYYMYYGENYVRLYLTIDTYNSNVYDFTIMDRQYNTFEKISIFSKGLERPKYNLTLKNIVASNYVENDEMKHNNSLIRGINVYDKTIGDDVISINLVGELLNSEFNDTTTKWFSVDLFFNSEIDYSKLVIGWYVAEVNGVKLNYYYKVLDDRVRLYLELFRKSSLC